MTPVNAFGCLVALGCAMAAPLATVRAGNWPQFRGPNRDGISTEAELLRKWPAGGPRVLWKVDACQGYAAAAIHSGRVYFNDYNRDTKEWMVRCLSLEDGEQLWRFAEKKKRGIRPNHGITRTVPAVDSKYVFTLDPKCVLHCLDATTGAQIWRKSLVRQYQTKIPPWYAGQCPLIEPDRVIVAPGGPTLMVALDKATGETIWETSQPADEQYPMMSHSSVMPAELDGVAQYVHATLKGVAGVSVADGKRLWFFPRKFNLAVAPSPLVVGDRRIFMTSLYNAGSTMIQVQRDGDQFVPEEVYSLPGNQWNSEVHTPILYKNHMFAVGKKKRGMFTCLDLKGNVVWTSERKASFGLGSFLLADGMFFVLEGRTGMLRLIEASTTAYKELDKAQLLSGDNVWGPMALADGKLVLRDMKKMICVQVGRRTEAKDTQRL
jgi:outer membrane protein assembly factor BamB